MKGNSQGNGRVQVFTRVRPFSKQEEGSTTCVESDDVACTMRVRNDNDAIDNVLRGQAAEAAVSGIDVREFAFDGVFPADAAQRDVFAQVGLPVLRECLKGFNGTILAYGQTGSGKTFSLLHQGQRADEVGLLPRLVASLFVHVAQDVAHVYQVEAAAVQIYNEHIDDLLHTDHSAGGGHSLGVQGTGDIAGLTWLKCKRPDELLEAFARARSNVVYAETKMNKASSRSHAVFQIRILKRQRTVRSEGSTAALQKMECTHAKLNIVDLAGSERVKKSGVEGAHLKEASAINKSLLAFGNVVSALAAKRPHIPFRDSKLTRVLDGSIGGNCKTSLLVCVSPASDNVCETLSTLEFASRAMRVEVDAKVNLGVVELNAKALLDDLKGNVEDLGFSMGSELDAVRRASSEALQRAQDEVLLRQKATAEAEENARNLTEKVASLKEGEEFAKSEVERLRERESRLMEQLERQIALHQEADAKVKEERCTAQSWGEQCKQLRDELEQERVAKHEEQKARLTAQQMFDHERSAKDAALRDVQELQNARARLEAGLAVSEREREDSTARENSFAEEAHLLRARIVEVEDHSTRQEAELSACMHELQLRNNTLEDASNALKLLKEEADAQEEMIRQQHAVDLRTMNDAHAAEMSRLTAEYTQQLQEADDALKKFKAEAEALHLKLCQEHSSELQSANAAHVVEISRLTTQHVQELEKFNADIVSTQAQAQQAVEQEQSRRASDVAELEDKLKNEVSRWSDEKSRLEVLHRATLDAQRDDFEARLRAGREEMDSRLGAMQEAFDAERAEQSMQFNLQLAEHERAKAYWMESKEEAVRQAVESADTEKRRITATFRAARCVVATRENELRQAHDELARRFAARESRDEDVKLLAGQQRRLEEQRQVLQLRQEQLQGLHRELKNRDKSDMIFGTRGRERRLTPRGSLPPLPGKKVGDLQPFVERRRRATSARREISAERSVAVSNVLMEMPLQAVPVR